MVTTTWTTGDTSVTIVKRQLEKKTEKAKEMLVGNIVWQSTQHNVTYNKYYWSLYISWNHIFKH